MLNLMHVWILS